MNHETPFTPPTYFIPLWHPTRKILAIGGQRLILAMCQSGESGMCWGGYFLFGCGKG